MSLKRGLEKRETWHQDCVHLQSVIPILMLANSRAFSIPTMVGFRSKRYEADAHCGV